MSNSDLIYETIILGSGPAGLTAAIYAGRSRCCPLLIHGRQPGGQLTTTTAVDNFPGFPEGIEGPDLMEKMKQQAERFGTQFVEGEVVKVDLRERPFRIWVGEEIYRCLSLIIATGSTQLLYVSHRPDEMPAGTTHELHLSGDGRYRIRPHQSLE